MEKKYLHILSFDGLSKVDIKKIENMPNFKEFFKTASGCKSVKSVYPSITYCAHTSITTGTYPNRHGIINNTKIQPGRKSPDWFWYDRDIKVPTFQSLAKKNGYDILSIFWPVAAGSKDLKYNMPEIFANRWWKHQIPVSLANGSFGFQYRLNSKFGKMRNGIKEPELDNFSHSSFIYSLENYKADINMVHYIDLDSQRHEFGFDSTQANDALKRLDNRLGDVVAKLKEIGIYEDSVIVVLGDHSSKDGHSNLYINSLFEKKGLLKKKSDETIESYDVMCKSSDGSAYIYAKEKISDKTILDILNPLVEDGIIEKIYTSEEANALGGDPQCRFMLEAVEGYFFIDDVKDRLTIPIKELVGKQKKLCVNNHGYSPHTKKDYETVFFISGKGIKKNVFIEKMSLVDEGPTFAKIMGFNMKNTDGVVRKEFLEV